MKNANLKTISLKIFITIFITTGVFFLFQSMCCSPEKEKTSTSALDEITDLADKGSYHDVLEQSLALVDDGTADYEQFLVEAAYASAWLFEFYKAVSHLQSFLVETLENLFHRCHEEKKGIVDPLAHETMMRLLRLVGTVQISPDSILPPENTQANNWYLDLTPARLLVTKDRPTRKLLASLTTGEIAEIDQGFLLKYTSPGDWVYSWYQLVLAEEQITKKNYIDAARLIYEALSGNLPVKFNFICSNQLHEDTKVTWEYYDSMTYRLAVRAYGQLFVALVDEINRLPDLAKDDYLQYWQYSVLARLYMFDELNTRISSQDTSASAVVVRKVSTGEEFDLPIDGFSALNPFALALGLRYNSADWDEIIQRILDGEIQDLNLILTVFELLIHHDDHLMKASPLCGTILFSSLDPDIVHDGPHGVVLCADYLARKNTYSQSHFSYLENRGYHVKSLVILARYCDHVSHVLH